MKNAMMTPAVTMILFAQLIPLGSSLCEFAKVTNQQDEAGDVSSAGFSLEALEKIQEEKSEGESQPIDPQVAERTYRQVASDFTTAAGKVDVNGDPIENNHAVAASAKIAAVLDRINSEKAPYAPAFKLAREGWNRIVSQAKKDGSIDPKSLKQAYDATADAFLALARHGNAGYGLQG